MADMNKKPKHPYESFISKLPSSDCDAKNQANTNPAINKQVAKVIPIYYCLSLSPRVSRLIFLLRVRDLLNYTITPFLFVLTDQPPNTIILFEMGGWV